ncbi:hypothetical protein EDF56_11043 [Novosphingobium sp. PhB165]|uniref:hypothetical protein n=1 Tax=Novosphingobium sp. PhB165 TaxID=2485105 RepID=UPI001050956A|nr:hypothetical protein [Novosphingobium sp. PhB165]TCM15363.1 hypothetical protein EDF56_11043 [Novosphingobium sp. PhB165]
MFARIVAILALLVAAPALADDLSGQWDLRAGGVAMLRFELHPTPEGWKGTWQRPDHYRTEGYNFSKVTGPAITSDGSGEAQANGDVALQFDDPHPHSRPDRVRFRLIDPAHAKVVLDGGMTLRLSRSTGGPMGPWDSARTYPIDVTRTTNPDMTRIFKADLSDRKHASDGTAARAADGRRARTQQLLDADALDSGEDFEHAAAVFQHGEAPGDYLKAHLLAIVAVARGRPSALTIASESFDRYLAKIGHADAPSAGSRWASAGRSASDDIARASNPEMTAIFEADQSERKAASIDWTVLSKADERRRARTQELLDAGALNSGEDFEGAAFVFQHGDAPDDFLKAHLLATIAVARGKPGAVWIVSATLDRYLERSGRPQVLGTQFQSVAGGPMTQDPYDRTFASDSLREALNVPSLADQEVQQQQFAQRARQQAAQRAQTQPAPQGQTAGK